MGDRDVSAKKDAGRNTWRAETSHMAVNEEKGLWRNQHA